MMKPNIKLSAPDWCFFKGTIEVDEYYRRLKEMGVSGVEMLDPVRWPAARRAGLEILNLCAPGMASGLNREERHKETIPMIRNSIAEAGRNGIPYVIVFSGNREGQDDKVGMANCVTGLKAVARDAEKARVTLLFEMLNSMDHVDYQADRSAYGFGVVRAVKSRVVKVVYDIYHMHRMGEDTLEDIIRNLDLIRHIHVAEAPRRTLPLANGNIHYQAIVKAAQEAGYAGYWGLEFVPQGDPLEELKQACELFRSF